MDEPRDASPVSRLWHRPLPAAVGLLLAYVVLASFMSTGGYLGTDTGAKVATLDVMEQRGTSQPVLGYWAEDLDPAGDLHPIYQALSVDDDWVHVTTLPMLQAARPLWALGGYRATLLLPMLGAVGAAFASRALARRAAGEEAGWQAFWVVGLASPITIYALDFWEHAPGVACMVGATALLAGIVDGEDRVVGRAMAAGALLGLAATMRTETFVYSIVIVGGAALLLAFRRREVRRSLAVGLSALAGFAGPWLANAALEAALGGNERSARVTGTASRGFDEIGERAREAVITLLALRPGPVEDALVLGGLAAALGVAALVLDRRGDSRRARVALAGAAALHLISVLSGLGFVPGLFAAAPVALAAIVQVPAPIGARYALGVAVGTLPLVWAFQFLGGAGPQWAGRYALTSCTILVALGVAGLQRSGREVRLVLVGLTAFISLTGVLWLHERSHEFERLFEELVERPEDVVVARNGFFIREGGDAYSERLWLTAVGEEALERSFALVAEAGFGTLAVLDESPTSPPQLHGATLVETVETSVVGVRLYLHSYQL